MFAENVSMLGSALLIAYFGLGAAQAERQIMSRERRS
jgi:hypothetical protein